MSTDVVKPLLVYDTGKGFDRFLKRTLPKAYKVDIFKKWTQLVSNDVTQYDTIFVVLNDYQDVVVLTWAVSLFDCIFVASNMNSVNIEKYPFTHFTPLNFKVKKSDMMRVILNKLEDDSSNQLC